MITQEQVEKAFEHLEDALEEEDDLLFEKSSEDDIDEPEGSLMKEKTHQTKKMSDEANDDGAGNQTTDRGKPPASKKKSNTAKGEVEMEENDLFKAVCKKCDQEMDMSKMASHMQKMHGMNKMKMDKSFSETADDEIEGKIEVSDFLRSLHNGIGEHLDAMKDAVNHNADMYKSDVENMRGQLADVQESQANLGIVLKAICERMRIVEDGPARGPKADTVSKGSVVERDFATNEELNQAEEGMVLKGLSPNRHTARSQISAVLADMVIKGEAKDLDLIGFESDGFIPPELQPILQSKFNG